jgi:6-phospho-3-hexuloisomerase
MERVIGNSLEGVVLQILEEVRCVFAKIKYEEVDSLVDLIVNANRVFVHGAGRVGIVSRAFAMRLMHLGKLTFWIADDTTPGIGPGDLLLVNSGSGNSECSLSIAVQAKKAGAEIATITANMKGKIAGLSDATILLPGKTFKIERYECISMLPMGSQFELCLWIIQDILSLLLMEKTGIVESDMIGRHRNLE